MKFDEGKDFFNVIFRESELFEGDFGLLGSDFFGVIDDTIDFVRLILKF